MKTTHGNSYPVSVTTRKHKAQLGIIRANRCGDRIRRRSPSHRLSTNAEGTVIITLKNEAYEAFWVFLVDVSF